MQQSHFDFIQCSECIDRRMRLDVVVVESLSMEIGESPWCFGNSLSLADIAVGSALGYLVIRFAEFDWQTAYPNLGRLYEKLMLRSSFSETIPQG